MMYLSGFHVYISDYRCICYGCVLLLYVRSCFMVYYCFFFCLLISVFFFFFFFQAEDGIRDTSVTGVQTCALPISLTPDGRRRVVVPGGGADGGGGVAPGAGWMDGPVRGPRGAVPARPGPDRDSAGHGRLRGAGRVLRFQARGALLAAQRHGTRHRVAAACRAPACRRPTGRRTGARARSGARPAERSRGRADRDDSDGIRGGQRGPLAGARDSLAARFPSLSRRNGHADRGARRTDRRVALCPGDGSCCWSVRRCSYGGGGAARSLWTAPRPWRPPRRSGSPSSDGWSARFTRCSRATSRTSGPGTATGSPEHCAPPGSTARSPTM